MLQYRRQSLHDASDLTAIGRSLILIRHIWSTKALDAKRLGVGKRRLAGHHLRQQAAGCGPERQAVVVMPEIEPQSLMARGPADHRQHVGQTRPGAFPGFYIEGLAQWKQLARARQRP